MSLPRGRKGSDEENTTENSGGIKICRIRTVSEVGFKRHFFFPRFNAYLHLQGDNIGSGVTEYEKLYGSRMVLFIFASATFSCDKADKLEAAEGRSLPLSRENIGELISNRELERSTL